MRNHMLRVVSKLPITLSYIATGTSGTGTSATSTQVVPSTAAVGDLAVVYNVSYGNAGNSNVLPTLVVPTGFTLISNTTLTSVAFNYRRIVVSAKILTLADLNSTLTGMEVSLGQGVFYITILRGSRQIQSFTVGSINSEITTSITAEQTVTPPSLPNLPFVVFGYGYGTAATPSLTMIPTQTTTQTGGAYGRLRLRIDNTTAQTTTWTASADNGINAANSFYIIPVG